MAKKKTLLRIGGARPLINDEAEKQLAFLSDHYDRNSSATVRFLIKQEYNRIKKKA